MQAVAPKIKVSARKGSGNERDGVRFKIGGFYRAGGGGERLNLEKGKWEVPEKSREDSKDGLLLEWLTEAYTDS